MCLCYKTLSFLQEQHQMVVDPAVGAATAQHVHAHTRVSCYWDLLQTTAYKRLYILQAPTKTMHIHMCHVCTVSLYFLFRKSSNG